MTERRILVVEDEPTLGEMIRDNLLGQGHDTELVRDGIAASERIAKGHLDLVVLDLMLPERDGFEVLTGMRENGDETAVLILSARSLDNDRIRGLELGADDYLTKPFNLRELLLRVTALLRRSTSQSPDVLEFGGNRINFRSHDARNWRQETITLTPSEMRLLRMLAGRAGEVVPRQDLVDALFGPHTAPTHRSLDNMMLHLRQHFERDSKHPQYLHTVRGAGLRLTLDNDA